MAKLTALVLLLALGLVSTVSARHLLFNVGENKRTCVHRTLHPSSRYSDISTSPTFDRK